MALVTVFGGTGFLGRRIIKCLADEGETVRVAARHPTRIRAGGISGESEPTLAIVADVRDEAAVAAAIAGADAVVNAVSAYVEKAAVTYEAVHVQGAKHVAEACERQGISRLVHISGIGADPASPSPYIRARGRGELAVRQASPRATILRPSVLFARDDAFLNTLARIARSSPIIPLIGGGQTRLQPVHADDVAKAVCVALHNPTAQGTIYELGGPESTTLRAIFEMVLAHFGRRRLFVRIPFELAHPLARLLEGLPRAPLTVAQVDLLRGDSIPAAGMPGLRDLGIAGQTLQDTIATLG
ncbi:MAG: complex I NDUFA9 subunit family protein [Bradyrhizobium sp.]